MYKCRKKYLSASSFIFTRVLLIICSLFLSQGSLAQLDKKIRLPLQLIEKRGRNIYISDEKGQSKTTTLIPFLQKELERYLKRRGNPISALVILDVQSAEVLALVQGKEPRKWGSSVHTALYAGFPAASLFKTVTTAAALEVLKMSPDERLLVRGDCLTVEPSGYWLLDDKSYRYTRKLSFKRAFALSCNSAYAKLAMNHLGIKLINNYAKKLGWGKILPTDFLLEPSYLEEFKSSQATVASVGKFAAGFGMVGLSPMHAAWMTHLIATKGLRRKIRILRASPQEGSQDKQRVLSEETALKLQEMMQATVLNGTASSIFRKRPYRHLRRYIGGKTGTLYAKDPSGLSTWFAGFMPIKQPEIVVAALVVNKSKWVIKGAHLAAEAFLLWTKYKKQRARKLALKLKTKTKTPK